MPRANKVCGAVNVSQSGAERRTVAVIARSGTSTGARVVRAATLALALLLLAVPPGWAQPDAPQASAPPAQGGEAQGWAQGSSVTGDWGGHRTRLGEVGLAPYAIYSTEGFGTVAGGIGTGLDWTSQLEFGLDVDAGKLAGFAGGAAHASFLWIEGTDPSENRVGNVNRISGLSAPAAARVYELWYKQTIFALTAKLGQMVVDDDFMVSANAALYFNAGFGTYPTFTVNTTAPSYPLAGPGAFVQWQVTERLGIQSGVYVGDAGPNDSGNDGFGWRTDHGAVIFYEAAYKATLGALPGTYKAGGYDHTGRFDDPRFGHAGRRHQGNYSVYALADQALVIGQDGVPTVAIFAGFGVNPQQDRNPVHIYGQGGLNVTGPLPPRPKDVLGLGVSGTRFSDDLVQAHRVAGTPVAHQEVIVELTYQAAITRFLTLQPDLQVVFDANRSRQGAVVLGLRLQAKF
jgi:porin